MDCDRMTLTIFAGRVSPLSGQKLMRRDMASNTLVARAMLGIAMIGASPWMMGQSTGTISGFVTDPSAAALAGAKVTATQGEQDIQRTVETNEEGFYTFNALPPGEYSIAVEKSGFQRLVNTHAVLTLNQNLRVDLTLRLGQISQ